MSAGKMCSSDLLKAPPANAQVPCRLTRTPCEMPNSELLCAWRPAGGLDRAPEVQLADTLALLRAAH